MPLHIIRNDITKMEVDAIVNAANSTLLGGGGVDGAIHRAAGPGLLEECRTLGGCMVGHAKRTAAYDLPCRYVIHTVGPQYRDGLHGEEAALRACYRASMEAAREAGCRSVAFPLISAGVYGYPREEALRVAVDTLTGCLLQQEMSVFLVLFDTRAYRLSSRMFADIAAYIDDHYVETHTDSDRRILQRMELARTAQCQGAPMPCAPAASAKPTGKPKAMGLFARTESLDDALKALDEGFSEMLLRKIDERGMKDSQCYKKAGIDRKLFSKIRGDRAYRPSKPTALAFAVALELSLAETEELLKKAGFALSHSNKFDIIVEYFIARGQYDLSEINEALYAFDQSLLGG